MTGRVRVVVAGLVVLSAGAVLGACGSDAGGDGERAAGREPTTSTTAGAPTGGLVALLDDVAPEVAAAQPAPGSTSTTASVSAGEGQGYEHGIGALRGLGDDPDLDAKALDCHQADLTACDDLYVASPDGSLYEVYGATCGARIDAPTNRLCVDVLLPTADDPTGLGDDAFLDALAAQCHAGDLLDCDLLYAAAESGSQYEAYGATCGRRIETDEDCTTALL